MLSHSGRPAQFSKSSVPLVRSSPSIDYWLVAGVAACLLSAIIVVMTVVAVVLLLG